MQKTNLRMIRDELRVQLHLAEMDAKSTWQKLQPRLHELGRKFRSSLRSLKDQVDGQKK